ncbi:serine protease [Paucibacter sp. O1-1]|nr:serine protease [Paucibacter sp. O1-1]MDA3830181.1 serine protease [Paucibacter sp. O1-1]
MDAMHFIAVGWVQAGVVGKPLALRDAPVQSYETQVRVAQWSEEQFIVRAGMVVATDAKERIQYAPDKSREVSQVMNLRVLSEAGSAGAPVLDEDGRLAGMIFGGEPGQESSFAAPASAIKVLLSNALAVKAMLAATLPVRDPGA